MPTGKAAAQAKNRRRRFIPLEDAEAALQHFVPCDYGETVQLFDGIRFRMVDAGHLLGSASIEMWVTENGETQKIVFSGDIGNLNQPIIRDPQYITQADYVVMESTYGNREHEPIANYIPKLAEVFDKTFAAGGNVVIPSFAVGRTQELLVLYPRDERAEACEKRCRISRFMSTARSLPKQRKFTAAT